MIAKAVAAGFDAVAELRNMVTPELIRDEVLALTKALEEKAEGVDPQIMEQYSFETAKRRAQNLLEDHQNAYRPSRAERRAIKQQKEEAEAAERQARALKAKQELDEYLTRLIDGDKSLTAAQLEALRYFRMIYVDDKRDPQISYLFPRTSRDQRYQWKTRANKMVMPFVSEQTRQYITERTRMQPKKILQVATAFYNRCIEG